jgi:hypothetical protein
MCYYLDTGLLVICNYQCKTDDDNNSSSSRNNSNMIMFMFMMITVMADLKRKTCM